MILTQSPLMTVVVFPWPSMSSRGLIQCPLKSMERLLLISVGLKWGLDQALCEYFQFMYILIK